MDNLFKSQKKRIRERWSTNVETSTIHEALQRYSMKKTAKKRGIRSFKISIGDVLFIKGHEKTEGNGARELLSIYRKKKMT